MEYEAEAEAAQGGGGWLRGGCDLVSCVEVDDGGEEVREILPSVSYGIVLGA